jgi:hypothetical protein
MNKAYTLGATKSYDQCLIEEECPKKLGERAPDEAFPDGYEGGWIWKTPEEAEHFRINFLHEFLSDMCTKNIDRFCIYELELPNTWEIDAKPGVNCYHLKNDAKIVRKVILPNPVPPQSPGKNKKNVSQSI